MGKLKLFEISFSNKSGVFYAGTILQGQVNIELAEPMNMRGISLRFEGKAYVHWTERQKAGAEHLEKPKLGRPQNIPLGQHTVGDQVHYSAKEVYFNHDSLLFGILSSQGSSTTDLAQGRHEFPFQFQLPPGLPSSFEGKHGYVRYTVKCIIDKPWKFDHTTKCPFTVISLLDLNQQPNCSQKVQGANQKSLCCLCCKSGPIEATFHLDRSGYVPGEAIQLFAEINNGTNRKIAKSYVDLKMVTMYHATTKSKMEVQEVAHVTRPGIEAHGQDQWREEKLVVPPLPPSFLTGCRIIDVRYSLQLTVDPAGPAFDLEIPLDIIIGTIPLVTVVQQLPPVSPLLPEGSDSSDKLDDPEALYPTAPVTGIPDMPPPSYSKCITGKVNIREEDDNEHTGGNMDYTPIYPYYNWGHTPSELPEKM